MDQVFSKATEMVYVLKKHQNQSDSLLPSQPFAQQYSMPSMYNTANVSLDLQRAKLTSPMDVQAETEVYTLLQVVAINSTRRLSDPVSRPTRLASSTAFSKVTALSS